MQSSADNRFRALGVDVDSDTEEVRVATAAQQRRPTEIADDDNPVRGSAEPPRTHPIDEDMWVIPGVAGRRWVAVEGRYGARSP